MDTTSVRLDNVCQHGFWVGQGAAPCPFCHPECYANGTQGTIAPLITVNVNTIFDAVKDARISALESALAAARAENERLRKRIDAEYERGFSHADSLADSHLRSRDEGRVERVAEELKRQFTVGVVQAPWWHARARAVLAAADRREP